MRPTELFDVDSLSDAEIQRRWEEAYVRFETPEQEIRKFVRRLETLGQKEWDREAQIVEIFCGRGNGLEALERLGFRNLEGVDISSELLSHYSGPAKMYEADCRKLPFEDSSRDILIVQGGLHHLPNLPEDVEQTLAEVRRVLRPEGRFVMVEPWLTPFLRLVHLLSEMDLVRRFSEKFDAFATMTHYEARTYFNWLGRADELTNLFERDFKTAKSKKQWGKVVLVSQSDHSSS